MTTVNYNYKILGALFSEESPICHICAALRRRGRGTFKIEFITDGTSVALGQILFVCGPHLAELRSAGEIE